MTSDADVETISAQLSEGELAEIAEGAGPAPERMGAIKELARRASPRATPALTALVRDATAPADLRSAAAVALAKDAKAEHQSALLDALPQADARVLRRVAEALGRIGGPEALPALRAVRPPGDPAAERALVFAKSLIAYRHGLAEERLELASARRFKPEAKQALPLKIELIKGELAAQVARRLAQELPALPVSVEGGVGLTCAGHEMALLPTAHAAAAARASSVPAVLLKRSHSLGYFSAHLYILSHPVGDGRLALFGVRPDGSVTHAGGGRLEGDVLHFEVQALDTPHSPPVSIEGRLYLSEARLEVTEAVASPERAPGQQRAKTPQRAP